MDDWENNRGVSGCDSGIYSLPSTAPKCWLWISGSVADPLQLIQTRDINRHGWSLKTKGVFAPRCDTPRGRSELFVYFAQTLMVLHLPTAPGSLPGSIYNISVADDSILHPSLPHEFPRGQLIGFRSIWCSRGIYSGFELAVKRFHHLVCRRVVCCAV